MICQEFPPYAEDPFWTEGLPEATHQYILQDVTKSACSSSPPISAWGGIDCSGGARTSAAAPGTKFKLFQLDGRDEPSFAHQTGDNTPGILLLVVAYRNTANITASRPQETDAM